MNMLPRFEGSNLRIMSSNLLFDDTAPSREDKILENISYYQPDIIGFQEVNKFYHESFVPKLKKLLRRLKTI